MKEKIALTNWKKKTVGTFNRRQKNNIKDFIHSLTNH